MAMKATQVTTGEVRISYEHLLKPYANKQSANQQGVKEKYSCTLLIPKSDIATKQRIDAAIQAAIQEGIAGKWGGVRPPNVPIPIHDGDGVRPSDGTQFNDECKGHWVMAASSEQQPEIVDASLQHILNATEIYSGMYARVNVNFFHYFSNGKKGIGCGLGPVQKTRDGEPLAGHMTAEDAFGGMQQSVYQQPAYQQAQPYAAQGYQQPPVQQPAYPTQQPYAAQYAPTQPSYPTQQPYPGGLAQQVNPLTGEVMNY